LNKKLLNIGFDLHNNNQGVKHCVFLYGKC
jgi:hypothetical protein